MFRPHQPAADAPRLQLTSLIDVVFLLLIFFVMTFRLSDVEGDHAIRARRLELAAASPALETLPIHVRVAAGRDGELAAVWLNGRELESLAALRSVLASVSRIGDGRAEGDLDAPVRLDCDPALRYEHVIATIDAVHGYRTSTGEAVPCRRSIDLAIPPGR
jgi:biopolymer transport protein ExbD